MSSVADNLCRVHEAIAAACQRAGRSADAVRLVAVSKTMEAEIVRQAFDAGQRLFGENREQELNAKAPVLPGEAEWHFIGHLQRNKVRPVLAHARCIHSVDRLSLLHRIDALAAAEGVCPRVLIQVNVSGEDSKFGLPPADAEAVLEASLAMDHVDCRGLMTMAPFGAQSADLHRYFADLRDLRDRLNDRLGVELTELSMGMSADYPEAIAEGATLVRIGSAIFGSRGT